MTSATSYKIKTIEFFGRTVPILCQNENGPCPLLAICNVLLLQGNIRIHPDYSEIAFSELTQHVAEHLLDANPPHPDPSVNANQQTQLDAVIKLLPRLQYGLDVNVRFNSPTGFEFTEEMAAFDMSGISLLHGWVLDPQDRQTAKVLEGLSYNQLVEKLMNHRAATADGGKGCAEEVSTSVGEGSGDGTASAGAASSARQTCPTADGEGGNATNATNSVCASGDVGGVEGVRTLGSVGTTDEGGGVVQDNCVMGDSCMYSVDKEEEERQSNIAKPAQAESFDNPPNQSTNDECADWLVAEAFYRETASQLTYYGLHQLHQVVRERQLCIFFRNNHFSSLFKYEGKLYLLITDLGYAREYSVVWEKLDQIDGDTEYVNSKFLPIRHAGSQGSGSVQQSQHDQDYMLALALQGDDSGQVSTSSGISGIANQGDFAAINGPNSSALASQVIPWQRTEGDEAVALALLREEEELFQREQAQRVAALPNSRTNQGPPVALAGPGGIPITDKELANQADIERRAYEACDRRQEVDVNQSKKRPATSGSFCIVQ